MSKVVHVTDENFQQEVMESDQPVMIDFSASWCGPCKQLAPVVEDLAQAYDGRIKVAKIDIEEAHNTALQYGILSVPTILFLKNGEIADQMVGNQTRQAIEERIAKML